MQRLNQLAKEMEDDEIIDYGMAQNIYGSSLSDVIVFEWEDRESPWQWIRSNPQLKEEFEKVFVANSKERDYIELFRGIENLTYLDLKKGDTIQYSDQYTSWSTDRNVSLRFCDDEIPILLIYKGSVVSFDLGRTNRDEKEHILPPMNFVVSDVINIQGYDHPVDGEAILELTLNGFGTSGGKGRIIFLEALVR